MVDNAVGIVSGLVAKCDRQYIKDAWESICKELAEVQKPSHNSAILPCGKPVVVRLQCYVCKKEKDSSCKVSLCRTAE